MSWSNLYFEALEEWEQSLDLEFTKLDEVLFMVGFHVGFTDWENGNLESFKKYIQQLLKTTAIEEKFLIKALVNETTDYFEHRVRNHGEAISLHLRTVKNPALKDKSEEMIDRLTSPAYYIEQELVLDSWKQIIAVKFSNNNMRNLENEEFKNRTKGLKGFAENLTPEELNKPVKEFL